MKKIYWIVVVVLTITACSQNKKTEKTTSEESFIQWGKTNAISLHSTVKTDNNTDLKNIAQSIGDARLVVLSEGFHNCKEMMELHHRIIQYLVQHHGFNIVVTESGLPESKYINDYIHGKNSAHNIWEKGVNKMYGEWQEGRALIHWMHEYNTSNHNVLDYYGIDIGGFYNDWITPLREIITYLKKTSPVYAKKFSQQFSPYESLLAENARVNYIEKLSPKEQQHIGLILDETVDHFRANKDNMISKSNLMAYEWAKQSTVAMQLAQNYYQNYINRKHYKTSKVVGLNGREIAMHRNLQWVLQQRKDAKVIVIDHVIHTKTASQFQGNVWGHFTPAGELMKQALKDDIFIIGMAYGKGKFWNKWQNPDQRFIDTIQPSKSTGIEQTLEQIKLQNFYINWKEAPLQAQQWLNTLNVIRENDYFIKIRPNEWDACIYLDNVSPATPVQ